MEIEILISDIHLNFILSLRRNFRLLKMEIEIMLIHVVREKEEVE